MSDTLSSSDEESYNAETEKKKIEEFGTEAFDFQEYVEKLERGELVYDMGVQEIETSSEPEETHLSADEMDFGKESEADNRKKGYPGRKRGRSSSTESLSSFEKMKHGDKENQRATIQMYVNLKKSHAEIVANLKEAYGDRAMSERSVRTWARRFELGASTVHDLHRSGRKRKSTVKSLYVAANMIYANKRVTEDELALVLKVHRRSVRRIVRKIGLIKKYGTWIPYLLLAKNQKTRFEFSIQNLDKFEKDASLASKFFCGDETPILGYTPLTRQQSAEWVPPGGHTSQIPRKTRFCNIRRMATIFMGPQGFIYHEITEKGATIKAIDFMETLKRFRGAVDKEFPELSGQEIYILLDNSPIHKAKKKKRQQGMKELMMELKINPLQHPPYSPDLMPLDFLLNPELKAFLRGKNVTEEELEDTVKDFLSEKSRKKAYSHMVEDLKCRYRKTIEEKGGYAFPVNKKKH